MLPLDTQSGVRTTSVRTPPLNYMFTERYALGEGGGELSAGAEGAAAAT
jgi:hypothetical protein